MELKFSESWVYDIVKAAGEKDTPAHAIEVFWQSERAGRAQYWRQNPIRRVSDERLYRQDNDDEDEEGASVKTPGIGKKALAIGVLLAILSIPLEPVQSVLTNARESLSQTGAVNSSARNPVPLSCYRMLRVALPPPNPRDPKHYASANECALSLAP